MAHVNSSQSQASVNNSRLQKGYFFILYIIEDLSMCLSVCASWIRYEGVNKSWKISTITLIIHSYLDLVLPIPFRTLGDLSAVKSLNAQKMSKNSMLYIQ